MGTQERHDQGREEGTKLSFTVAELRERVEYWQQKLSLLGVAHVRVLSVDIVDELEDPSAAAGVTISDHYDSVFFEFNRDEIANGDQQTVDECIIHEWVHVAMHNLDYATEALYRWLPEASREDTDATVTHQRERFVERMARTLYALYSESC